MPRRNYRHLVIAALYILLAACSSETAEDHLAQARAYAAAGASTEAVIELKNALQKDATLAEARWLLGQAYLAQGDTASAAKELQRAVWMEWEPARTVPAYALALLAEGDYEAVIELPVTGLHEAALASLYASQGAAYAELGKHRDARRVLVRSLELAPDNHRARLTIARLDMNTGDVEAAKASLDTLVKQAPDEPSHWAARGDLHLAESEFDAAAAAYDRAIALQPDNIELLGKRTLLALQAGDMKATRRGSTAILKLDQKHLLGNFIHGITELDAGNYDKAEMRLERSTPIVNQFPEQSFYYGTVLLLNGKTAMAREEAIRFYALQPGSVRGRKLLAIIRSSEGDHAAAEELLVPVLREYPSDAGAMRIMATALLRQGKSDEGIELLARLAALEPDSAQAQISLGAGLLMQGEPAMAREHIATALALDPGSQQADVLLVMAHVQAGDFVRALATAEAQAEASPDDPLAQNLVGWVQMRAGNTEAAIATYRDVTQRFPGEPGAHHALARAALQDNDLGSAASHYEAVLAEEPDHLASLLRLALIEDARGDNARAELHLDRAIEAHPETLQPRLLLARYYLSNGDADRVGSAFFGLPEAQQRDPAVVQLMAIAQLAQSQPGDALFTLQQLNAADTDSASYHYLTAMAAAGMGDADTTARELDAALALAPELFAARIARARLAARQERLDSLRADLSILEAAAPDSPDVLLLQAAEAFLSGDLPAATRFARSAHALGPSTATVLALGGYLEKAGDQDGAGMLYSDWLADNPDDTAIRTLLANETLREGGDPIAQYRDILARDPDNVIALNNLAWLTRETDPAGALSHARRAERLAPENPSVLDTLAMVELANGNNALALSAIDRALSEAGNIPSSHYHKAVILLAAGDRDGAQATLQRLVDAESEFPEYTQAVNLLRSLTP